MIQKAIVYELIIKIPRNELIESKNNLKENGFVDTRDGEKYRIVKIGSQVWMAENLRATKYNDNNDIPLVMDAYTWAKLATPGYCWYNNDEAKYKSSYGAIYNWYAVNTGKLCPKNWHIPNDNEWTVLTDYLGGINVAGSKLRC